ncbi:ABC transporter permease [Inediibacterium massiliense]|uniref:ABC transporter permease n=1 Tax=Inediibacterium massiliense TaxID=1658111 RepID=UPI0006B53C06|nr:ABC transporter permease [Inediibacterium massiliense]
MITALSMEFYKIRCRRIGLTVFMIMGVQFMWALWAMRNMDAHKLSQGWMYCIYIFSQINCIMMPIVVAVVASRLSDIEHKGCTLKLLKTIMPDHQLFMAKFLCGTFYMIITVILQIGIMVFMDNLRGFTQEFPIGYFFYYILFTLLTNLTLLLLQFIFSLLFINQMIAFIIAIAGAFLGLYSLFVSENIARFVLWGYYGLLSPVRIDWNRSTRILNLYWTSIPLRECFILLGVFVLLYIIGKKLFIGKEI